MGPCPPPPPPPRDTAAFFVRRSLRVRKTKNLRTLYHAASPARAREEEEHRAESVFKKARWWCRRRPAAMGCQGAEEEKKRGAKREAPSLPIGCRSSSGVVGQVNASAHHTPLPDSWVPGVRAFLRAAACFFRAPPPAPSTELLPVSRSQTPPQACTARPRPLSSQESPPGRAQSPPRGAKAPPSAPL